MSFTAEVKDELSRIEDPSRSCRVAELSALMRVCGTLSFHGSGTHSLRVTTETGAVARTVIRLAHSVFDLNTSLTVRRSVLHKTRNYLIEVPDQPKLEGALVELGILVPGQGLVSGIPPFVVPQAADKAAFLRGAFMAGGFIADPRGDFHLEMAVSGEGLAQGLIGLCAACGVTARLNRRRGAFAIYLKSFDDIARFLLVVGAARTARAVGNVRHLKSVKNTVNRSVNAEMANARRASGAAAEQLALIGRIEAGPGLDSLPPALAAFCKLRRAYPNLPLSELGRKAYPPLSKSALYHRVVRLEAIDKEWAASRASLSQ